MTPDIKSLRKQLGWSQKRLAEFLRLNQSTVSRIEAKTEPVSGPVSVLIEQLAAEAGQ